MVTDVGAFQNCNLEQRDKSHAILDSYKRQRGWIQYDVEASKGLHAERCVVVGGKSNKHEKYYILVVKPTNVDGEYTRVGVRWIQSDCVVRERLNVRIV